MVLGVLDYNNFFGALTFIIKKIREDELNKLIN